MNSFKYALLFVTVALVALHGAAAESPSLRRFPILATSAAFPASHPLHRLKKLHRFVLNEATNEFSMVEVEASSEPPAKLTQGVEVHHTDASKSAETYEIGEYIASGNFGNVYRLADQPDKVIKQMYTRTKTATEDGLARAYQQLPRDSAKLSHLALMDESFLGSAEGASGKFKFQTGPYKGGSDLEKYMKVKATAGGDVTSLFEWANESQRNEKQLNDLVVLLSGLLTSNAVERMSAAQMLDSDFVTTMGDDGHSFWGAWLEETRKVAQGIGAGLKQLHGGDGITGNPPYIHDDVKPANIFLTLVDGTIASAAVGDFGLAEDATAATLFTSQISASPNEELAKSCPHGFGGSVGGTALYWAPELVRFGRVCAPVGSNDVWSAGITLFEMVTAAANRGEGKFPFEYMPYDHFDLRDYWNHHTVTVDKITTLLKKYTTSLVRKQALTLAREEAKCNGASCSDCFPSEARVTARTPFGQQVTKRMEELQVGDEVLTSGGFSPIFAFMDHTAETKTDYVRLHTTSGATVSATADHIIFAHETQELVMAGSIKVGDTLWVHRNATVVGDALAPAVVVRVEQTEERGLHAPLTKDGSIIVDGVLASSYAKSASLTWGTSTTLVTGHTLNMFMHAPLRFACEVSPSLCGPEWHIATSGRHQFTEWILTSFGWLQKINAEHADLAVAMFGEDATSFSIAAALVQLAAAAMLAVAYYGLFVWHPAQALAIVAASVVTISCVRRNKAKVE